MSKLIMKVELWEDDKLLQVDAFDASDKTLTDVCKSGVSSMSKVITGYFTK